MKRQRDAGFYWVQLGQGDDWTIAQWTGGPKGAWYPIACELPLDDEDLAEIDPNPIRRDGTHSPVFSRLAIGVV